MAAPPASYAICEVAGSVVPRSGADSPAAIGLHRGGDDRCCSESWRTDGSRSPAFRLPARMASDRRVATSWTDGNGRSWAYPAQDAGACVVTADLDSDRNRCAVPMSVTVHNYLQYICKASPALPRLGSGSGGADHDCAGGGAEPAFRVGLPGTHHLPVRLLVGHATRRSGRSLPCSRAIPWCSRAPVWACSVPGNQQWWRCRQSPHGAACCAGPAGSGCWGSLACRSATVPAMASGTLD